MTLFAINMLLAVVWAALMNSFGFATLVAGFIIGFVALWAASPLYDNPTMYFLRVWRIVRLALYFVYELLVSSLQVVQAVIMPRIATNAKIIEVPLDVKSDAEILLVTSLISLTPGTLSIDVTEDRKTLFVHAMFAEDPDAQIAQLKSGMERMVREVYEI